MFDRITSMFDRVVNHGLTIGAPLAKSALDMAVHDLLRRQLRDVDEASRTTWRHSSTIRSPMD